MPKRLRAPLNTLGDIRRELARTYRELKGGRLEGTMATRRCYVLQTLSAVIVQERTLGREEAVELRLAELERLAEERERAEGRSDSQWFRAPH